jgi:hypothetical protein
MYSLRALATHCYLPETLDAPVLLTTCDLKSSRSCSHHPSPSRPFTSSIVHNVSTVHHLDRSVRRPTSVIGLALRLVSCLLAPSPSSFPSPPSAASAAIRPALAGSRPVHALHSSPLLAASRRHSSLALFQLLVPRSPLIFDVAPPFCRFMTRCNSTDASHRCESVAVMLP